MTHYFQPISSEQNGKLDISNDLWCKENSRLFAADLNQDGKYDLWCNIGGLNYLMKSESTYFIGVGTEIDGLQDKVAGLNYWCKEEETPYIYYSSEDMDYHAACNGIEQRWCAAGEKALIGDFSGEGGSDF